MQIQNIPYASVDWSAVEPEEHAGVTGKAIWRVRNFGDVRVRLVEYSAGYLADHWCLKGHFIFCLEGELVTELRSGDVHRLRPGMMHVLPDGEPAHRSHTDAGVKLIIVD